jgi:inorganic pyrophosphatase
MSALDWLGKTVTIRIDRPLGSRHPQHGFLYPVNYGYLPGVMSPDGEELDAYLLGVDRPFDKYTGVVIAVIVREDDQDDKLVVAPAGMSFSDEQIRAQTYFQERWFKNAIRRGYEP